MLCLTPKMELVNHDLAVKNTGHIAIGLGQNLNLN